MLDDCRAAFAAGKHLLAHAPTGLGKTAAALTAAIEVARERGLLVVALTSRQTQHAIFVETLKLIHARLSATAINLQFRLAGSTSANAARQT